MAKTKKMKISNTTFIRRGVTEKNNQLITIGGEMIKRTGEVVSFKVRTNEHSWNTFVMATEGKLMPNSEIFEIADCFIDFEI